MISRTRKFRYRRLLRLRRLQVEELGQQAEEGLERNFFKRIDRLMGVRRFIFSWLLLLFLLAGITVAQISHLNSYYQVLVPSPGGNYSEGIQGLFTNANPIYAQSLVDTSVSHLVFAGLFKYNEQNQLVGDLAESIDANSLGTVYTVHLRPHLTWQDGRPLTANDVAFTYHVIQNPDAQSPLYNSWQNVTVSVINPTTVTFTLSNPLASFPNSLTNGIIPAHLLQSLPMENMRSDSFNTQDPIGSGPFSWTAIEAVDNTNNGQDQNVKIALKPFNNYYGGKPKLDSFIIQTFDDQNDLVTAFSKQQITAMVGLDQIPNSMQHNYSVWTYDMPETSAVMAFFRTTNSVLNDVSVRQALVSASDTSTIIRRLGYPAEPVVEPLLHNQLGYNPLYAQSGHNLSNAVALLNADGWALHSNGLRYKNGAELSFKLYTENTSEYIMVAKALALQWRAVGANVQVISQDNTTFQNTLTYHEYDAVLCGISIGVDPDVFVYWDSSQADVRSSERLNLSEWSNTNADDSLEAGRTRLAPSLRIVKYQEFLQAWQKDAPALGLYQPRFLYITRGPVYGLSEHTINTDTDRFDNVQNWEILQTRVTQ